MKSATHKFNVKWHHSIKTEIQLVLLFALLCSTAWASYYKWVEMTHWTLSNKCFIWEGQETIILETHHNIPSHQCSNVSTTDAMVFKVQAHMVHSILTATFQVNLV